MADRSTTVVLITLLTVLGTVAPAAGAALLPAGSDATDCEGRTSAPGELDVGEAKIGESTTGSWTFKNPLNRTVTVDEVRVGGEDADAFSLVSSSGPIEVGPGECSTVRVEFSPQEPGDYDARLTVTTARGTESTTLDGQGIEPPQPEGELSTGEFDFGRISVSDSAEKTVVVENDGDAPLRIEDVGISGSDAFSLVGEPPQRVEPGGSAEVTVRFDPSETAVQEATLTVQTNASSGSTLTAALRGEGIETELEVSQASLTYGELPVGQSQVLTVTLDNTGSEPIEVSELSIAGEDPSAFTIVGGEAGTIEPGESKEVAVRFQPELATGYGATLQIQTATEGAEAVDVTLSGSGAAPDIEVTPASVNFGKTVTDEVVTRTIRIRNRGSEPLEVTGLDTTGANPGVFFVVGTSAPLTVPPGESREVTVRFAPSKSGRFSASLVIESNDPSEPTKTVYLSNTKTTVRQETEQSKDGTTNSEIEVQDADEDQTLTFVFSGTGTDAGGYYADATRVAAENTSLSVMNLTVDRSGNFNLGVKSNSEQLQSVSTFYLESRNGTAPVTYHNISHTIDDENIDSVEFTFTVSKARLDRLNATIEDFAMYRYVEGEWVELDKTVVDETSTHYVVAIDSPGLSDFVTGVKQPKFEFVEANIRVQKLQSGDETGVRVVIDNVGGADGTYTARLLLDGEVIDRKSVTIASQSRRVIVFEREVDQPGTYTVKVNDVEIGQIEVTDPEGSGGDSNDGGGNNGGGAGTATGADGPGGNGSGDSTAPVPGFGPGIALLSVLAAALVARRRRERG